MPAFNELSILIFSKNRHSALRNIVNYYQKTFDCHIIISDDSASKLHFKGNVKYINHNGVNFWQRLFDAAKEVRTAYCLVVPDDDYALLKGVSALLSSLERSKVSIAAQGLAMEYRAIKHNEFEILLKYKANLTPYINGTLCPNNSVERIECLSDSFFHAVWALYRTKTLQTLAEKFLAYPNLDVYLGELAITVGANLLGPINIVNTVVFLRDITPSALPFEKKGIVRFLSNNHSNLAQRKMLLDSLCSFPLPDTEYISQKSKYFADAESPRKWLWICLYRIATARLRPLNEFNRINQMHYSDEKLKVTYDNPWDMGDPDFTIEDLLPIVKNINMNLNNDDLFYNKFPSFRPPNKSFLQKIRNRLKNYL